MINPFQTRFGTIFQNEVLLNSKRVAPYALMILFAADAGAASISTCLNDRSTCKSPSVFPTLLCFRSHHALGTGRLLLYRRNSYAQLENRLRFSCLFLSALHRVRTSLTKGLGAALE